MEVAGHRNGLFKRSGEKLVAKEDDMNRQNLADNERGVGISKMIHRIRGVRVAALAVLMLALSATAKAQCGDSLSAMAASAASARSQSRFLQSSKRHESAAMVSVAAESATASDNAVNTSIVGLWHIRFLVGDQQIQEAFQIWNTGGTEVHNPNVDPRQGNVCVGAWKEAAPLTFKLTHRVWLYNTSGDFQGIGVLTETLVLGDRGATHSGSFTLAIYDPSGNLVAEVPGTVVGERISVN
jgi:hypothetical protein